MRNKPKLNLGLTSYEDLFKDADELKEGRLPKIYDIPIKFIDDFPNHPFKVKMDEDMTQLVASIKEQGLITPIILRSKENGRYEVVSEHRRKIACKLAGLTEVKAEVREMTDDEAIILMVESNLQRSVILPSEKAFSYKMRLEALKRQGKRTDLTSNPLGGKLGETAGIVGENSGDSATQVRRFIRLTDVIPELLNLVDENKIALRPAVELSYLTRDEQETVFEQIINRECTPSHAQAIRMRKLSEHSALNEAAIKAIMKEDKPNQVEKVHIPYSEIRQFIPRSVSYEKTGEYIKKALEFYQKHRKTG